MSRHAPPETLKDAVVIHEALEAVIELHDQHDYTTDWGAKRSICSECSDPENGMTVPFPCPTIRAIQDAGCVT